MEIKDISAVDVLMVVGPSLGYLLQTHKMVKEGVCEGFSPYVSFIMMASSMIRIFWWYSERFSTILLSASFCMIIAQLILLHFWTKIRRSNKYSDKESFWHWNHFSSYVKCLLAMTLVLLISTRLLHTSPLYQTILGSLSSGIEAFLPLPQFILIHKQKHVQGLSVIFILNWVAGDFFKLYYYLSTGSPFSLVIATGFQMSVDFLILGTFFIYSNNEMEVKYKKL